MYIQGYTGLYMSIHIDIYIYIYIYLFIIIIIVINYMHIYIYNNIMLYVHISNGATREAATVPPP